MLEGKHFQMSRNRVTYDAIRYVQTGRAAGWIRTPEHKVALNSETWWSERDHSWGTRPLPWTTGGPPSERREWRMLSFCPIQFDDFAVHLYAYEADPDQPQHLSVAVTGPGAPKFGSIVGLTHDLHWVPGAAAPTLDGGTLILTTERARNWCLTWKLATDGRSYAVAATKDGTAGIRDTGKVKQAWNMRSGTCETNRSSTGTRRPEAITRYA